MRYVLSWFLTAAGVYRSMSFLLRRICYKRRLRRSGFTMLELMVIVAIVAILMGIAAPGWIRFLDTQRLISAQNIVYQGIQQAQAKSQQTHSEWQFSIRDTTGSVEWSVHPKSTFTSVNNWELLGGTSVQIDSETTLQAFGSGRTVRFDHKGNVVSRLGRVTLSSPRVKSVKRCVYVSTLIGALRQSKQQDTSKIGDFCY